MTLVGQKMPERKNELVARCPFWFLGSPFSVSISDDLKDVLSGYVSIRLSVCVFAVYADCIYR